MLLAEKNEWKKEKEKHSCHLIICRFTNRLNCDSLELCLSSHPHTHSQSSVSDCRLCKIKIFPECFSALSGCLNRASGELLTYKRHTESLCVVCPTCAVARWAALLSPWNTGSSGATALLQYLYGGGCAHLSRDYLHSWTHRRKS